MQRFDAHVHFWKYNAVRDSWITDDMAVIQKDFFPPALETHLMLNRMDGVVAVQASQSEAETDFLLQLAEEHDLIKGVVGWVDLQSANITERLKHYSGFPQLKGFRHVLQGEAQRDLMLQPAFMNGIRALKRYGYTYDVLIYRDQLRYLNEFLSAFPNQKFVLDHLSKPSIATGTLDDWEPGIREVAYHENLFCKVSGMVTEANWRKWKKKDFVPYLDVVVEAFGTRRLLFGSDWPVCLVAGEYEDVLQIVSDYFSAFTKSEQADIFGGNTKRFYHL